MLAGEEKIKFEVSFKEPQAHYVEVLMHISGIKTDFLELRMPVWTPGSYLIREFPKNVEGFQAIADGGVVHNEKVNKNTWKIETKGKRAIEVSYRVYGYEVSVRTSFIDASHAFLSPTGIFMFIEGKLRLPAEVKIIPYGNWARISTGLPFIENKPNTFYAANFDILFDSPIEVGNQDIFTFEAANVYHEVAMVGGGNYDKEKLKEDMTRIVEEQTKVYGDNPNERYVFIVHNYYSGGGGLEHLNSTVLGASRFAYGAPKEYKKFLGLVAHEYFHLWNVKRLRPENLGPFDYSKENYTSNLWISEGFTAYYDNLTLRRCDFYGIDEYLEVLADDINGVENRPGNLIQSLSCSSFDAWIKQYRPTENSHNSTVSYYTKGAIIAMFLDLQILMATQGEIKLDEVMRQMYVTYYVEKDRGFTRQEFEEMASRIAGTSLSEIFNKVDVVEPLDYNRFLNYAGLELIDSNVNSPSKTLGLRFTEKNGKGIISMVLRGSGAWEGGINVGDEIIAVNDYRILEPRGDLEHILSGIPVGSNVEVTVARDGRMVELPIEVKTTEQKALRIRSVESPTALQVKIRKNWLSEK